VTLIVEGDEMTVDLTGTAPQVPDRPINMPLEGTVDCAIWLTLRSILLDSAVYGHIPQNRPGPMRVTVLSRIGR
jgi:N-methylhydantoinase B